MSHEENLLFAAFAVQLTLAPLPQTLEATAAWAAEPDVGIPERLLANNAITVEATASIRDMVVQAIAQAGGDAGAALEAAAHPSLAFGRYVQRAALDEATRSGASTLPATAAEGAGRPVAALLHETPGRYRGDSEYARGGMGRVLLVHDTHLGRDIAMKELLPNVSHSSDTLSLAAESPVRLSVPLVHRFLQEARITGQLEHPSIVPVYELGHRPSGQLYYTMKLVRGETLARAIRKAGSPEARLALLPHFVNLCQAIAYAHSRGVLHRDIKPSNVMVGEFGETVVLDWGLAKARGVEDVHEKGFAEAIGALNLEGEEGLAHTEYGQIVGTPAYMPPEQALGHLERVDERSDVYSLGAVLYEILTGNTPHTGVNKMEILARVQHGRPEPVRSLEPKAPPELAAICEKALRADPADRYQAARELAEDAQHFLAGAVVGAYAYSPWQILHRLYRRHRIAVRVGMVACTLLAAGLAYYNVRLHQSREGERRQRVAVEERNAQLREEAYASSVIAAHSYLTELNSERALEYLDRAPEGLRGWEWGAMRHASSMLIADAPHEPLKVGTVQSLRCLFNRDDSLVLSKWSSHGAITLYDRGRGDYVYYSPLDYFLGFPGACGFGPDPGHFTAGLNETTAVYFNWEEGRVVREFHSGDDAWLFHFLVDGSGQYAAGITCDRDAGARTLVIWDFQTGAVRQRHDLKPWRHPGYDGVNELYRQYFDLALSNVGHIAGFLENPPRVVFSDEDLCTLNLETAAIERKMPVLPGAADLDAVRERAIFVRPDGTVGQWDLRLDQPLADLSGAAGARGVVYGGRDRLLAGVREQGERWSIWEAQTGELIEQHQSHTLSLSGLDIAEGEPVAATLSHNSHLKFWRIRDTPYMSRIPFTDEYGEPIAHDAPDPYSSPYRGYAVHPDRNRLATRAGKSEIRLWRIPEMALERRWDTGGSPVLEIAFNADGRLMATAHFDGFARVWNTEDGALIRAFAPEAEEACYTVAIAPGDAVIALGYGDRSTVDAAQTPVLFYSLETGALLDRVNLAGNRINDLAWSPDGALLFAGVWGLNDSTDHSFVVYRNGDWTAPAARVDGLGWGHHVEFDNGRHALLHGGNFNPVYFDCDTLRPVYEHRGVHAMTVAFHPEGDRFVTTEHSKRQAHIHRTSDGRVLATLNRVVGPAFFSANGMELYALTPNGQARVFRAEPWR